MQKNAKSLDELYEEILNDAIKLKPNLTKACLSSLGTTLIDFNPIFCPMIIPPFLYITKAATNMFNIINTLGIDMKENAYNSLEYLKFEKKYFLLIDKLKKMLQAISVDEPMEIFAVYYYLVLNGYLSVDHEFYADNKDLFYHNLGSSIFSGVGVCRNLSPFLTDLLREYDYESYTIQMHLQNTKIFRLSDDYYTSTFSDDIEDENDKLKNYRRKNTSDYNHVSTLLADKDKSFIMDPMNNTFYTLEKSGVFPYGNIDSSIPTNLKKECLYHKNAKICGNLSSNNLETKQLVSQYNAARQKCETYASMFEYFYLENRELYRELLLDRDEFAKKYTKIRDMLGKAL